MALLHFSLIFSGTVQPNGGDQEANDIAMTAGELAANLEQAVSSILSNGQVTGDTPATLEDHSHRVRVTAAGQSDLMVMPIISMAHLDPATALDLSENGDQCTWATIASYKEGLFIRFFDAEGLDADVPEAALAIRQWLKSLGVNNWVRLDRDWDRVPGLPAYEW
ncbi:MAG: hypothetical protein R3260_00610 [Pseudomonas sp.]|nr:hypothetical protein [Pseudomonas sp.]